MIVLVKNKGYAEIAGREGNYYIMKDGSKHIKGTVFSEDPNFLKCKRKCQYTKREARGKCLDIIRVRNVYVTSFKCPVCDSYHIGKPKANNVDGVNIGQFKYTYGKGRSLNNYLVILPSSIPVETLSYP